MEQWIWQIVNKRIVILIQGMVLVDPNDNATMKAKDLAKVIQDVVASNV